MSFNFSAGMPCKIAELPGMCHWNALPGIGKLSGSTVFFLVFLSIIVACSHFGAMCGGNDIDYNIIYGRGKSSRAGNKNYRG